MSFEGKDNGEDEEQYLKNIEIVFPSNLSNPITPDTTMISNSIIKSTNDLGNGEEEDEETSYEQEGSRVMHRASANPTICEQQLSVNPCGNKVKSMQQSSSSNGNSITTNDQVLQSRAKTVRIGKVRWPPPLNTNETFESELQRRLEIQRRIHEEILVSINKKNYENDVRFPQIQQ